MKNVMKEIQNEVSKKRLYATVKEVSNFHRIQASTGFRDAANYMCKKLCNQGLDAKVLSFDADENHWYLEQKLFQEWDCKQAWLEVEGMGRIADFEEEAMSVLQKSYPCDYSKEPLEIIMLDSYKDEYLDQLDLKGKLCFIHERPNAYLKPCMDRGALGFITDYIMEVGYVRERNDAYDTLQYTSFWWHHTEDEPKGWGFVLSPRVGDHLRKLCLNKEAAYQKDNSQARYPKATCKIDSKLYPGKMEVVEVVLPGETDEEVMAIAHLCHPKASANDNSSGVAGSSEALRVLKHLTETGKIPPLKRTIRLTLVPEMTGTYCYLSTKKSFDHIVGAINMDMIGGHQDGFYGPVTITATNHALNSPITSIASMVLKYTRRMAPAFMGDPVPMVNSTIEAYAGGSDHVIYSDPSINVPCIMLGQWPDKYYHTSSDTLECVDPNVLAFSTTFATGFLYALSNFDEAMHKETMLHHARLFVKDVETLEEKTPEATALGSRFNHFKNYYMAATENFKRYGDVDTSKDAAYIEGIAKETKGYLDILDGEKPAYDEALNYVPVRDFVGPVNDMGDYASLNPENKAIIDEFTKGTAKYGFGGYMMSSMTLNYLDGKRTVNEIVDGIKQEAGSCDPDYVQLYIQTLIKLGKAHIK